MSKKDDMNEMTGLEDLIDLNEMHMEINELEPSEIKLDNKPKNVDLPTTPLQNTPLQNTPSQNITLQNQMVSTNKDITLISKNGWNLKNQSHFQICLHRLKYYRVINNFYFFELKKREGRLSWAIIVLSSFSSVLSLITSDKELFPHSPVILKWLLVLFTLITTLIGAFIKKQQFIDKINIIDRYLQQLNQTIEDLNITAIIEPDKRDSYDEFCKKYIPIIKNLSVSPASFSPKEWKQIVYTITTYYPELIYGDGSAQERLWPWFHMNDKREESNFGKIVIDSYNYLQTNKTGYSVFKPTYLNKTSVNDVVKNQNIQLTSKQTQTQTNTDIIVTASNNV
jgi:hypothetical protein